MRMRRRKELVLVLLLLFIGADLTRCESNTTRPLAPSPSQSPKNNTNTKQATNQSLDPAAKNTTKSLDQNVPAETNKTSSEAQPDASSKEHCCGTKVVACLSSPGDADNELLTLEIKSRDSVKVKIITPSFLKADPAEFTTSDGQDSVVKVEMVDAEAAKLEAGSNPNITIQSDAESCPLPVPSQNLGYSQQEKFSYTSTLRSPVVGLGMLFVVLVIVLGLWAYHRYRVKNRSRNDGNYVELEMGLQHDQNHPGAAPSQSSNPNGISDDWDEVWDEDWEEPEKKSPFKLTESLSSKGLATRRTQKEWND